MAPDLVGRTLPGSAWRLLLLLALAACAKPPFDVRPVRGGAAVEVSVKALGEYPATIERVQVRELQSDRVIWEIEGINSLQLWTFTLASGRNSAVIPDVAHGESKVLIPPKAVSFELRPGVAYQIEVWGEGSRSRKAGFVLRSSAQAE